MKGEKDKIGTVGILKITYLPGESGPGQLPSFVSLGDYKRLKNLLRLFRDIAKASGNFNGLSKGAKAALKREFNLTAKFPTLEQLKAKEPAIKLYSLSDPNGVGIATPLTGRGTFIPLLSIATISLTKQRKVSN